MKKKVTLIVIALVLVAILGFFGIRSVVGWRPYKQLAYEDMIPYVWTGHIDLESMTRESIPTAYFISMLSEIRVTTPYDGEYDPWSMEYFVWWEYGENRGYNRVGFALDPEPIIDIGGEIYRMTGNSIEVYQDFCKDFLK